MPKKVLSGVLVIDETFRRKFIAAVRKDAVETSDNKLLRWVNDSEEYLNKNGWNF